MMADVLCFGNLQLDILCRTFTALPPPGGIRQIDKIDWACSGNGGNVALALARLGVSVELAGGVGADMGGDQFRAVLAAEGVGVDKLQRHPTAATGTSVIALAPDGERSIVYVNGANESLELDDVPDSWLQGPRIVAVTAVFVLPQFTGAAIARLFRRARAAGAATLLNICWDEQDRGLPFLAPALAETDYFVLNGDEGRQLTGRREPAHILERLKPYTPGTVVLTLGAGGCCIRSEAELTFVPAVPVRAVDTTGAGDSFVAGFIAGLTRERQVADCARLGCQTAAYAVGGPGAYSRIPRLEQL